MPQFDPHTEASRKRGGEASRKQHGNNYRASQNFDWDAAIARFKKILAEVYGEPRK